jgi:enoyl-CoA hydratase
LLHIPGVTPDIVADTLANDLNQSSWRCVAVGEFVRLEVADGVGTIRLDRPKMNAISFQVQAELLAVATEAGERDDVHAVVVYGGERLFAAGNDVKEMADLPPVEMIKRGRGVQAAVTAVAEIPKPVVAAITGYALGGGCELALAADFRIAADSATFGQPEVLLGIIPGAGGTQRLPRLIGASKAKDLIFSGRFVKADEALAMGLVDRVVPAETVYDEAVAWATQYVGSARLAVRAAKAAIDRGLEVDLSTGLEMERMAFASLFATEDGAIGLTSFLENGPGKAQFKGA